MDKPLAIGGLRSYRYKGRWGYIMISAISTREALKEVKRSLQKGAKPIRENLEVYNHKLKQYRSV